MADYFAIGGGGRCCAVLFTENDGLLTENDGFCTNFDAFCRSSRTFVVALPDSGFFSDENVHMPEGCPVSYSESMRSIFKVTNASGGLHPDCLSKHASEPGKSVDFVLKCLNFVLKMFDFVGECMLAANAAPHIPMPYLMLQSRYDTWQTANELGSTDASKINAFGEELEKNVAAALHESVPGTGLFLDACAHHTAMGTDVWEDVTVEGVRMVDAVTHWLSQVFSGGKYIAGSSTWIAQDAFPCTEKCCGGYRPSPGFR